MPLLDHETAMRRHYARSSDFKQLQYEMAVDYLANGKEVDVRLAYKILRRMDYTDQEIGAL